MLVLRVFRNSYECYPSLAARRNCRGKEETLLGRETGKLLIRHPTYSLEFGTLRSKLFAGMK